MPRPRGRRKPLCARPGGQAMEDRLLDRTAVTQVLHHDAREEFGRDTAVPDALGVDRNDRPAGADAKTGRLAALDPSWTKQQFLTLQQRGQPGIERTPATARRAVPARADEHVPGVRF